ncbi:SNF2 family N-terminal domain-containing protein [Phyllosticta citribraziliensis]|uniref:SNF2 family N-terminal domain-containing protein n=1 Tax=Phyllosticta citribraziliensis TaxID=989973 RepID=A0ABR1LC33_9PEZI
MTIRTAVRLQSASRSHNNQLDAVPAQNALAALSNLLSPPQPDDRASSAPPPAKRRRVHSGLSVDVPDAQNPAEIDNRENLSLVKVVLDLPSLKSACLVESNNSLPARLMNADLSGDQLKLTLQNENHSLKDQFLLSLDRDSTTETFLSHLQHIAKASGWQHSQKSNAPNVLIPKVVFHHKIPNGEFPALELELLWITGPTDDEWFGERRMWQRLENDMFYFYFSGFLSPEAENPDPRSPRERRQRRPLRRPWTVQDFYNCVHVPPRHEPVSLDTPKEMTCDLFPFQKRAVQWMLARESATSSSTSPEGEPEDVLPPTFHHTANHEGRPCFVSLARRMVFTDRKMLEKEKLEYGGILCEEMGLGKTVELITLICLHRRTIGKEMVFDPYTDSEVVASGATLIVTPAGILEQWMQELARHAPHLKINHYKGMPPPSRKEPEPDLVQDLLQYDVVLTTYSVLSREIHYTHDGTVRPLRRAKQYEPRRSPLVQISWWRCCIDEAQMIESGVSQAAQVASRIPKIMPWAITGTPVKKRMEDLQGLLLFLRFWPFYKSNIWPSLLSETLNEIFSRISMRHTKDQVREELRLPPQKRIVMLVPFTPVEEQNYNQLVQDMCEDCALNAEGMPLDDDEFDNATRIEKMRTWLTRLRQTCLHPQVGGRNRRALGRRAGPLRTVEEVLNVMIEQNDVQVRSEERDHILAQLVRGHIYGFAKNDSRRSEKALTIYRSALHQAETFVDESRREVTEEQKRLEREKGSAALEIADADAEDEGNEGREASHFNYLRKALRAAIEVQHVCTFFVATAYFNIKSNEDITKPDSDDFKRLEELETQWYNKAQSIRKELLQESYASARREMAKLGNTADSYTSPIPPAEDLGGIENGRILDILDMVIECLNEQGKKLNEWRKKVVDILSSPLVDAEDEDTTGEEYEASAKAQDELQVYITFLRSVIADRRRFLTGRDGALAAVEQKHAEEHARDGKGAAPELVLQLAFEREQSKSATQDVSLQQVIVEVRGLITNFLGGQGQRAAGELAIAQKQLQKVVQIQSQEQKKVVELENEFTTYTNCTNLRVEFYRQLQHLSDQLKPYKEELDDELDTPALRAQEAREKKMAERLVDLKKKRRFLQHLKSESQEEDSPRLCVICQEQFELGVLTVCGHQYCKPCFRTWFRQHHNCPLCKRRLHNRDYQDITYKPQELRAHEEEQSPESAGSSDEADSRQSIYAEMSEETMRAIKSIDINGSFGTKIDTVARHLLWLRENDAGSKSVIFSQYGDFLEVLGDALRQFRIGFSKISDKGGVEKFKKDAGIECFLLDAKSDASGLNLVNASHVFLMEPLIHGAIELQAIARVHRIGQRRATTVYLYLVGDTVEQNIYEISVQRRLEHVAGRENQEMKGASSEETLQDSMLEAANSLEMEQAPISKMLVAKKGGGEVVGKGDLWSCLFGVPGRGRRSTAGTGQAERERERQVHRYARAEAAERRAE